MKTENKIRLHSFHDLIAISTDKTEQLYLTADQAETLARELKRYAQASKAGKWLTTRLIINGKAFNESNNKSRPEYL